MWWVWRWLPLMAALTAALPVPDDTMDTSTKLIGSSVVTSVSVVMGEEDGPRQKNVEKSDTRKVTEDLPASTVDMLKPDGFQFYTVDDKGQLITRQMTDAEIQSIIAAGGGPFPIETQDPQNTGENYTGDMKVADVVQNVQNVLKGELNKPAVAIGAVPTIPGHANEEWSSILPAILGGDTESAPVTLPESDKQEAETIKQNITEVQSPTTDQKSEEKLPVLHTTDTKHEEIAPAGQGTPQPAKQQSADDDEEEVKLETVKPSERPMIQVPVITAESVHSTTEAKPVYQILNTISADKDKDEKDGVTEQTNAEDQEPAKSSPEIVQVTEKTEDDKQPVTKTPVTVETVVEMEVGSSFVPAVEKESDKVETEVKPTADTLKVAVPSVTLEAPVAEVKPAEPSKSDEKEEQVVVENVKPATESDKPEKTEEAVEEKPTISTLQNESTTLAATIEQEVSKIENMMPESISSIVDELISKGTSKVPEKTTNDEVKAENPMASVESSTEQKPVAPIMEEGMKTEDTTASKIPEKEAETVFEIMPEISPESHASKAPESEVKTPAEDLDKTEQQTETKTQSSIPVSETSVPVTEKTDGSDAGSTLASVEKKPETLLTELADSVSSMISQVSEIMPSMVPIPQKSETTDLPVKRVDDGVVAETSTAKIGALETTEKIAIPEAETPAVPEIQSPEIKESQKPEKPDTKLTEEPQVMTSSVVESPEIKDTESQISSEVEEPSSTAAAVKLESPEPQTPVLEEKEPEVSASTADAEPTKVPETSHNQEKEKEEKTTVSKPAEESKPEMVEVLVKDAEAEAPIVRIDITEMKPTDSDVKNDDSTESSVVRIQLAQNPVSTIDKIIESASGVDSPVEVADIKFDEKDIMKVSSAQNAGSSLIAGEQPEKVAEKESPQVLIQLNPADKTIVEVKSEVENSGDGIEPTKIIKVTSDAKPEANDESSTKSPALDMEVTKTVEESVEKKPETPVEAPKPETETASVDTPVPVAEKVETVTKNEDEEKTPVAVEEIVEPVTVVSEDKVEATMVPEAVKESVDVPMTVETPEAVVPQEVVISTSVEVQPTKVSQSETEKPVAVKIDGVEHAKPAVEKIDEPESSSASVDIAKDEPESGNTETQVDDDTNLSIQNSIPVEVTVVNAPAQPQMQPSDKVQDVTTLKPTSEEKTPEKIETQVDATGVQNTESTEKKTEMPDTKSELPAKVDGSAEMMKKPEAIETKQPDAPMSVDEPEKETAEVRVPEKVDVKEPPVASPPGKDQASAPLVRIDISPEQNQPESTTTKTEKVSENADDSVEKTDKPEIPVPSTEIVPPKMDEPPKNVENVKDESALEASSAKPEKLETAISGSESTAQNASSEKTEIQSPTVMETEMVVKTGEESVKEKVDPEVPEVTAAPEIITSSSTLSVPKIEVKETTAKPVIRINNTPNNSPSKTQEIRIQVNDTAVLVTKQKIPQDVGVNKKVEPAATPSTQHPAPVIDSKETDKKPTKHEDDKVEVELMTENKKPAVEDPYVKLGEKKPEKKPVEEDAAKTEAVVNKKPANTDQSNKEGEEKWTLIPQSEPNPSIKSSVKPLAGEQQPAVVVNKNVSVPLEAHKSAVSLAESTRAQDEDISLFAKLCNELAFSFWIAANKGLSTARSLALSPFGMTSMLAMVFLGARGPTSGQMNDILKLDDVVTFNPHLVFQNVTDSVNLARGQGIANAAFVRELFADRVKAGRLLPFYRERAQQFYDGHVEEVNFAAISDLVRRRTNLLVRRQTGGRIRDFVKGNVMPLRSPLAALSANVFQTDCTGASSEGRDGEMYFAVLPAVRQRKLVPVPATVWRSGVLAGYEPGLDATVISLGGVSSLVSTIFVLPGQQGLAAPGDSLDHLERRLLEGAFTDGVWDRLLRVLIPRMGLEVQVPKFSHRSVVNATAALKRMGLDELFSHHADLKGINGVGNDLHLADMLQINLFSTCGDETITGGRHHVEIYPASPLRGARVEKKTTEVEQEVEEESKKMARSMNVGEYVELVHDLNKRSTSMNAEEQLVAEDVNKDHQAEEEEEEEERSQRSSNMLKEPLQPGKGKQTERPLLKLDRPFLYFVRHNPTGMILHMGRFNPRLMP